ncbi:MAG: hypothetical protein ACRDZM_16265, partial [Acidimicrobiia bacterium]
AGATVREVSGAGVKNRRVDVADVGDAPLTSDPGERDSDQPPGPGKVAGWPEVEKVDHLERGTEGALRQTLLLLGDNASSS